MATRIWRQIMGRNLGIQKRAGIVPALFLVADFAPIKWAQKSVKTWMFVCRLFKINKRTLNKCAATSELLESKALG